MSFEPRPFQEKAVVQMSSLHRSYDRWLLIMPPGAGKTLTFMYWLSLQEFEEPVWILMHEAHLIDQWLVAAEMFFEYGEFCAIAPKGAIHSTRKRHLDLKMGARIVFCMDKRVAGSIDKATGMGLTPKMIVCDEFHLLINRDGVRQARIWAKQTYGSYTLSGMTGTPINHELGYVQPIDFIPREQWCTPVTNGELTDQGFWAEQEYLAVPQDYLDRAEELFKGVYTEDIALVDLDDESLCDVEGEPQIISSSGRNVMRLLFEEQIEIISRIERRASESYMIFCADVAHAKKMADRLSRIWGIKIPVVTGTTSDKVRSEVLEGLKTGGIPCVCLVLCWLSGTDIPNACTGIFTYPNRSRPLFLQMMTRLIRPGKDECKGLSARFLDLALNVGYHGLLIDARFDEDVELTTSSLKFRDPLSRMCQNDDCLYVHDTFPRPRPSEGDRLKASTMTGLYSNGDLIQDEDPILCSCCDRPMRVDLSTYDAYVRWKEQGMEESETPDLMGLHFGLGGQEVTYGLLRSTGFYTKAKPKDPEKEAVLKAIDRSEEWKEKRTKWTKAYVRAVKTKVLGRVIDPSLEALFEMPEETVITRMTKDYASFEKGLGILLIQSFASGQSPLKVLDKGLTCQLSDATYQYSENSEGYSHVCAANLTLSEGYRLARASRLKAIQAVFLQSFDRAYARLLSGAKNQHDLTAYFEGWLGTELDKLESKLKKSQAIKSFETRKKLESQVSLLKKCLDSVFANDF